MVEKQKYLNIIIPSCGMWLQPNENLPLETECLFGEKVNILDVNDEWFFCKLLTDNYRGWIKSNALDILGKPNYRVISQRSFIFSDTNIKSFCINYLPLGSKLCVTKINENWAQIKLSKKHPCKYGYVRLPNLIKMGNIIEDWVSIAESLINTPYKWGGRDSVGIDCSALVQLSYEAYGQKISRNTNDQVKINLPQINSSEKLKRGYVVFWEGHVGIMVDELNCIHANAFHMKTVVEPLKVICKRFGENFKIKKIINFNNVNN